MNTKRGSRVTRNTKNKTNWAKLRRLPDKAVRYTRNAPRTTPEDWAGRSRIAACRSRHAKSRSRCESMQTCWHGFAPRAPDGKLA